MSVHDFDPTCHDDRDEDDEAERAYDRAVKRHAKADAAEYRATGGQIEPMCTFAEFVGGTDDDTDDTEDLESAA